MSKKPITMKKRVDALLEARLTARLGGGEARLQKQRDAGKMTARERIDALIDPDSFQEIGLFRKNRTVTFALNRARRRIFN